MKNKWWALEGPNNLPRHHQDSVRRIQNYLSFVISALRTSGRERNAFRFLADETLAKLRRLRTQRVRRRFDRAARRDFVFYAPPATLPNVCVFSLCHASAIPEQKLSILSFLRHVGSPGAWTIVSDGSLTPSQIDDLCSLHATVTVVDWQSFLCEENRETCLLFSKFTVFAKKLALETNMPVEEISVYADTDILFLPGAAAFRRLLVKARGRCFFQQDLPGYLDGSILEPKEQSAPPLNAGFVVLGRKVDWTGPLERLRRFLLSLPADQAIPDLEKLEQATVHLAHHGADSEPLDGRYVLQTSDRANHLDLFCQGDVALRHYTRPVRHKMWLHAHEYLA